MKPVVPVMLLLPAAAAAQTPADPYRAVGTEPFWGLTIDGRTLRLDRPGVQPVIVAAPLPRPSFNGRRYVTATMSVDITAAPCTDGMSDRRYPERVVVTLDRQTLRGCGGVPPGVPVATQRLDGAWTIADLDGRRLPSGGTELRFGGGRLTGNAGCNRLSASYTLTGELLRVNSVAATRMACPEPAMATENRVLATLGQPLRVRWIGRDAVLLAGRDSGMVLRRR